jgi:internalin A
MKTPVLAALTLLALAVACDEPKTNEASPAEAAAAVAPTPSPSAPPPPPAPPPPAFVKKNASDCKPHPATVDFTDNAALEKEVRRKLQKDTGPISPSELAQIKSINLTTQEPIHQIDPCIFPMFTAVKDLFLGQGDYDSLAPIQKLTAIEALRASISHVKDLRPIEGLKRMDRLDLSHTLIGDDDLKSVGQLVNVTELMLDEDSISDLTPIANLKKLERLSIKNTRVQNLVPIAGLHSLKFLYIAGSAVSDISPVQPLVAHGMRLLQN